MTSSFIHTDSVRSAVRFPLHLDVTIRWKNEQLQAVTEDVSASGILFSSESGPPVGTQVKFTLAMPAEIMGTSEDVLLDCIGRVVRHQYAAGKSLVAAMIEEYSLKG